MRHCDSEVLGKLVFFKYAPTYCLFELQKQHLRFHLVRIGKLLEQGRVRALGPAITFFGCELGNDAAAELLPGKWAAVRKKISSIMWTLVSAAFMFTTT
jgi:hypothetical protein